MRAVRQHSVPRPGVHGIDRMIGNVRTGHFERSLSALTAGGALVTAAEIYFEHDSASFGNKMMWVPVVLGPGGDGLSRLGGALSPRLGGRALSPRYLTAPLGSFRVSRSST